MNCEGARAVCFSCRSHAERLRAVLRLHAVCTGAKWDGSFVTVFITTHRHSVSTRPKVKVFSKIFLSRDIKTIYQRRYSQLPGWGGCCCQVASSNICLREIRTWMSILVWCVLHTSVGPHFYWNTRKRGRAILKISLCVVVIRNWLFIWYNQST